MATATAMGEQEKKIQRSNSTVDSRYGRTGLRRRAHDVITTKTWETLLNGVVVFNLVIIYMQVDQGMACQLEHADDPACMPEWYEQVNYALLAFYSAELVMAIYVERWAWFSGSKFNYVDAFIVASGYLEILFQVLSIEGDQVMAMIRLLKVLRVVRVVRLLKSFPELYMLVAGFMCTLRTMGWGFVMILVLLLVWGIVAVQVLTGTPLVGSFEEPWCNEAFTSVHMTAVWFFQTLVAGDSWGTCVVPIVLYDIQLFWLFAAALVTVELGFMNLILAVIVDGSAQTREMQREDKLAARRAMRREAVEEITKILEDLDEDGSGSITLAELSKGYQEIDSLQNMFDEIGVGMEDLGRLIGVMDRDHSGNVDLKDFASGLLKLEETDSRAQSLAINLNLQELQILVSKRFAALETMLEQSSGRPMAYTPLQNGGAMLETAESGKAQKPVQTLNPIAIDSAFSKVEATLSENSAVALQSREAIRSLQALAQEATQSAQRLLAQSSHITGCATSSDAQRPSQNGSQRRLRPAGVPPLPVASQALGALGAGGCTAKDLDSKDIGDKEAVEKPTVYRPPGNHDSMMFSCCLSPN
eukprot:TRINITY_DN48054_c0_g1_i1.p1 TRINITY_DN48054_c0_g1~~TRINITY_DN48054_c0_g1_i1.p1  ORF type:complete len:587 (+),score=99.43 TRINITY_DN48054_c0_g1_i1:48-1808(+)